MPKVRQYVQTVLSAADYPGEILTGVPVIEIKGTTQTEVIHHRGVLRYDDREIHIASALGPVLVKGEGLTIVRMNRERMVLRGTVKSVQFGEAASC